MFNSSVERPRRRETVPKKVLEVIPLSSIEVTLDRPANYYLIKSPEVKVLIDAGPRREPERPAYEADYVVLTHFHWDHVRGLVALARRGVPICASSLTLKLMNPEVSIERMLRIGDALGPEVDNVAQEVFKLYISFYKEIKESMNRTKIYEVNECPGLQKLNAEVLECPGHSDDHICIIVEDHAFIGDNLIPGGSVTLLDFGSYIKSMLNLLSRPEWRVAHPGHGEYNVKREAFKEHLYNEISGKLRRLTRVALSIRDEWRSLREILYEVYQGLDRPLMYVAARSLVGYVTLLERLGLVEIDRSSRPWRVRRIRARRSPSTTA
jgi:ribonuclease/clavin/mitogillin